MSKNIYAPGCQKREIATALRIDHVTLDCEICEWNWRDSCSSKEHGNYTEISYNLNGIWK